MLQASQYRDGIQLQLSLTHLGELGGECPPLSNNKVASMQQFS